MNTPPARMIAPLDFDELDPALRDAVRQRYERLGYLGDFFRFMAHQPRALAAFDAFTDECKSALGTELSETIALSASTRLANAYERNQHERLAVRSGLSREWIADVERLEPDDASTLLDDRQRAVQRFVLSAVNIDTEDSPDRLSELVALTDDATAVAIALLTSRFSAHAMVSRACRLEAAVPSIFEDDFDGG